MKKEKIELAWGEPAAGAVQKILRPQLEAIRTNEASVVKGGDAEALHDFRVAVRRIRTALSELEPAFDPAGVGALASGFSWLGKVTGPSRDLDVFLGWIDQETGRGEGSGIPNDLAEHLEDLRQTRQESLRSSLTGAKYAATLRSLDEYLALQDDPADSDARSPIGLLATDRLLRALRRFLRQGQRVETAEPRALHRLRIQGKKLRYLLEFFGSLFPGADIMALESSLKPVQDALGDFNDTVVQLRNLETFPAGTPSDGLESEILKRQAVAQREILQRYSSFQEVAVVGWLGAADSEHAIN